MHVSLMYGLAVRSELPLYQYRPLAPDSVSRDFTITMGAPTQRTHEIPPGRLLIKIGRAHV